ncbi:MAG: S-layer homology domain-containing protein [Tumebacillaceae bacterium]
MKTIRHRLSLFFASLALAASVPTVAGAAAPFQDIDGSFAKQDIQTLYNNHVIQGYEDGKFHPDAPITRAEFATMLVKAKHYPVPDGVQGIFRDVPRGEWYAPYAELSYRLGVTSGVDGNKFAPDDLLTREQMVRMTVSALGRDSEIARRMSYSAYSTAIRGYLDKAEISSWAVKQVAYAVQKGMLAGTYAHLNPQDNATRAEVAAMLNRSILSRPKGQGLVPVSRGSLNYHTKQDAKATAYTSSGQLSYTGLLEREGLIAVDPQQIPLGSHLFVPGYGYGIAGDTGGNIKSARVDLFMSNYGQAIEFGVRDVNVFVLD